MPQNDESTERRIRESWRVHACAAGLCAGAQVFLLGAGVAVPLCGNSAWIAALSAVPSSAAMAMLARRRIARGNMGRAGSGILALSCLLCAVFASAALCALAAKSLLPQARALYIAVMTAVFIALSAGGTGAMRLCFLIRWALPLALGVCAWISMPDRGFTGVFPLLGRGAGRLAAAAALMTAGAAPVSALALPPAAIADRPEAMAQPPCAGFFARRSAAGAAAGCGLLFLLCAGNTPAALSGESLWGSRMLLLAVGVHQGIFDTALILAMAAAAALHAAHMLACGDAAVCRALPRAERGRSALFAEGALLTAALCAFAALGDASAPFPGLLAAPAALTALLIGGRKGERA